MECAQLRITSGGTKLPSSTVSFPGAYTPQDVTFQLYWPIPTSYAIPGKAALSFAVVNTNKFAF